MTHSPESNAKLETCHEDLRTLVRRVDRRWSNTVLEGVRSPAQQRSNVEKGVSKTLDSKHLVVHPETGAPIRPWADAVDVAPDPFTKWPQLKERVLRIEQLLRRIGPDGMDEDERRALLDLVRQELAAYGKELGRWYAFAGYIHGVADELYERGEISAPIRHGYDWDGDHVLEDQTFDDLPHHERIV